MPPGFAEIHLPHAAIRPGHPELILRRPRHAPGDSTGLLLVATDPQVIAATREAGRRLQAPQTIQLVSGAEALWRLLGPGEPPRQLVLEGGTAGEALLSAARDPFGTTGVVVVARPGETLPACLRAVPPEAGPLAEALTAPGAPPAMPTHDAAALAAGMDRGEITVRFQPLVRMADGRPVMVEALARWERPGAALPPGAFVALAERSGLAGRLTLAVAQRALRELGAARSRSGLRLSFNAPLAVLQRAELPRELARIGAAHGFRPADVVLELTESTTVRDATLLRRALERLRLAGYRVLLDDLGLDDGRDGLLDLPFSGVKLDRSMIAAMPKERRARAEVERLVRRARRYGQTVIAEGVTSPLLWRLAAAAGCDMAQGFGVGRPLPGEALAAWVATWTGARLTAA